MTCCASIHDLDGRLLSLNPAPARVLGYSVEEMLQIPMREMVAPEFRPQFDEYLCQIRQDGEARGFMAVLTRSGERRIWEYHNTLRTEGVPSPIVRGIAHDVTERKRAEQEQNRTKKKLQEYERVVEGSEEMIAVIDRDYRYLIANKAFAKYKEMESEEVIGRLVEEVLDKQVFETIVKPKVEECFQGKVVRYELWYEYPRMGRRALLISYFPLEGPNGIDRVVAILRDVTEQKRAEERLREYEKVVEGLEEMIMVVDREYRYRIANQTYLKYRRLERDQVIGHLVEDVVGTESFQTVIKKKMDECFEGKVVRYELQHVFPNMGERDLYASYFPIEGSGGVDRIAFILQDITERKRAEEELRLARERLAEEKIYLEQTIGTELGFGEIIGESKALRDVLEQVGKVAATDATVLILGETGTGKELVARAIHNMSKRQSKSFIKVNCASIPSGLLESELFGHEKGAFTGAVAKKIGRLELADQGTVFLDEIGEIPMVLQPKLLRVLQDQEIERLGSVHTLKINFRLIAATNRDFSQAVREQQFRSDLYYRLSVFPIRVPPLRERREDIPLLVQHFVRKFANRMNKSITSITTKTMDVLQQWHWPGNIRELENFVERSVILTHGSVLQSPLKELEAASVEVDDDTLEAMDREHIIRALQQSRGRLGGINGAAERLGMNRTTLQSKLKRLGIDPRPYRN
jgi:PAS domain S-box-containing protein